MRTRCPAALGAGPPFDESTVTFDDAPVDFNHPARTSVDRRPASLMAPPQSGPVHRDGAGSSGPGRLSAAGSDDVDVHDLHGVVAVADPVPRRDVGLHVARGVGGAGADRVPAGRGSLPADAPVLPLRGVLRRGPPGGGPRPPPPGGGRNARGRGPPPPRRAPPPP